MNQKGFSQVILLGIGAVLIMFGTGGLLWWIKSAETSRQVVNVDSEYQFQPEFKTKQQPPSDFPSEQINIKVQSIPKPQVSNLQPTNSSPSQKSKCISNMSPIFTRHITDMNKVEYVAPPPTMGAGPSLKPHSYIGTEGKKVPIYAPVAMKVKAGSYYIDGPYMFEFEVSCEVTLRFGHVTEPIDSLKNLLPAEPKTDSRTQELSGVSFSAGDLIAYTTGTKQAGNWDFGVYNSATSNRYANDPNWNNSTVYTTAICPFNYFIPSLKQEYTSKFNSTIMGGNPPHGESFCK